MNTLFAHDTSMETLETYETIATAQLQQPKDDCSSEIFRPTRRWFPNLLDVHWTSSSSSSSSSAPSSSSSSSRVSQDATFLPWDEHQHQAFLHQMAAAAESTRWCASSTCAACRASPRFVAAQQSPKLHRLAPKWWEQSSRLTSTLAEQLESWLESKVVQGCNMDESRFWRGMEDHEDEECESLIPFDEADDDDDPRYASF